MTDDNLVEGATYFRVTFADPQQTMIGVEPMVFLGEVTTEDDDATSLAFQSALSYSLYGHALEIVGAEDEVGVVLVAPRDVSGHLLNHEELEREVSCASERASKLGYPTLKPGPWRAAP